MTGTRNAPTVVNAAYTSVVKQGRSLFREPKRGSNGEVCAQCHRNGATTHPET